MLRIKGMLVACSGVEAKFLVRGLQGKLRIGLAEKTVVVSLAHAVTLTHLGATDSKSSASAELDKKLEDAEALLRQVLSELPSFDEVVPALLAGGVEEARRRCKLTPGIPVEPMLAKPTKGVTEVLDRLQGQAFTCEWKYDGERGQVCGDFACF